MSSNLYDSTRIFYTAHFLNKKILLEKNDDFRLNEYLISCLLCKIKTRVSGELETDYTRFNKPIWFCSFNCECDYNDMKFSKHINKSKALYFTEYEIHVLEQLLKTHKTAYIDGEYLDEIKTILTKLWKARTGN